MIERYLGVLVGVLGVCAMALGDTPKANVEQCGSGTIAITQGAKGKIVYEDDLLQIRITGGWASASEEGGVITFKSPASEELEVFCRCTSDGWSMVHQYIDGKVNRGRVEVTVRCDYAEEDEHSVRLDFKSEWNAAIDLDCDANWDGRITEEDDPIEVDIGGTVGYGKYDALELKLDLDDAVGTNGTVYVAAKGGISLCSVEGGVEEVIVATHGHNGSGAKRLSIKEAKKINCVKGVAPSEKFCDCEVRAVLMLPGGFTSEDTVRYTVVNVDISIDGQDEENEEEEGTYSLFVDDFGETPYAPRATNYLKRVEMWITPKDFPEELQTNIWIEVSGDLEHLFENKPVEASWGGFAPYSPATNVYTMADLNRQATADSGEPPMFALHGHAKSNKLRDRGLTITEPKTEVDDTGKFTVVKLGVVPDYDRDHIIGDADEKQLAMDKKFYWWVNDDHDKGDSASFYKDHGSEIHGAKAVEISRYISKEPNMTDKTVNGRTDLLDFFPMWLDAYEAFALFKKAGEEVSLEMEFMGLGIVGTKLEKPSAGAFLTQECYTSDGVDELHKAGVDISGKTDFSSKQMKALLESVKGKAVAGIFMTEGGGGGDVTLFLKKRNKVSGVDELILAPVTKISTRDVRDFYSVVSLYGGKAEKVQSRSTELDELFSDDKNVFSLHGFKVDATHAEGWHSEFFKRLYQSQSYARFWGVTWDSNQSDGEHPAGTFYHQDAAHAFKAARLLKGFLDEQRVLGEVKGEVSMMAHSLGNMVVSPAVKIEGMKIDRYIMLDAAVPAEAYDGEKDDYRMINPAWREYPVKSFCSKWYQLFGSTSDMDESAGTAGDARMDLKWPELFKDIGCRIYNYYSPGDEVFELAEKVTMASGFRLVMDGYYDLCRYCWHKQEVGKGADMIFNMLVDENPDEGVSERSGGWGFHNTTKRAYFLWIFPYNKVVHVYTPAQAEDAPPEDLRRTPVFAHSPAYAFEWDKYDNNKTREYKTGLLCHVIPAMSKAAGWCELDEAAVNRDLDSDEYKDGWGRNDGTYNTRWLHCDLKDMAYRYNHKAWEAIVADGNFMKEEDK